MLLAVLYCYYALLRQSYMKALMLAVGLHLVETVIVEGQSSALHLMGKMQHKQTELISRNTYSCLMW